MPAPNTPTIPLHPELVAAIANYLAPKPWNEVHLMLDGLEKAVEAAKAAAKHAAQKEPNEPQE